MIKYRCFCKETGRFIFPVLDVSNNFYINYPPTQYIFDEFLFEKDGIEYYENDIVLSIYWKGFKNNIDAISILKTNRCIRIDRYLNQINPPVLKYQKYTKTIGYINEQVIRKLGNIHQNMDLLYTQIKLLI